MAGVLVTNNAWGTLNNEVTQFATEFYLTPGQATVFLQQWKGLLGSTPRWSTKRRISKS